MEFKIPKKLIEVALPLDDINEASAREKSIRHGHPSTLHLWWARRPLAAAKAVIFAQLVNDPGYQRDIGYGVNKREAESKREDLFQIIRELVKWENINNQELLTRAREAIKSSWEDTCYLNRNHPKAAILFDPKNLPAFHDPFAGGGALPLEAQRLGLESFASDLNPVAVMINKAMIEFPPKFSGRVPVAPRVDGANQADLMDNWSGAKGLAEDIRRYGLKLRECAEKQAGEKYSPILIDQEVVDKQPELARYLNQKLTVIAYVWCRTIKSPNPAFSDRDTPLATSFLLSDKKSGKYYVNCEVGDDFTFNVKFTLGDIPSSVMSGTKSGRGNFACIYSGAQISNRYIDEYSKNNKLGQRLMAVILEGTKGRVYLSPTRTIEKSAQIIEPYWQPSVESFGTGGSNATGRRFGFYNMADYFTARQNFTLSAFSDALEVIDQQVERDTKSDEEYRRAIRLYLSITIDRLTDTCSSLTSWIPQRETIRNTFARQVYPMTWDFIEVNPFSSSTGSYLSALKWVIKSVEILPATTKGIAVQADAANQELSSLKVVSTDPPYYDNIGYADLSDFFYVWMRKNLRQSFPEIFSTMVTPKDSELVALPYRHDSKENAEIFFLDGMKKAMSKIATQSHPCAPITVYYAFKQSETTSTGTVSSGWEVFLEAVIQSDLVITGTWPLSTERASRSRGIGANALASSIVLVCQKRSNTAGSSSRRDFISELRQTMPEALSNMIGGETGQTPIAPVDLAQASIGPGIAIFSKYDCVLNQDGSKMSVHEALILINRAISEFLNPDGASFDSDTLFCDEWFNQYGWASGKFGEADTLSRAKGTSVDGVRSSGVIDSQSGTVRLFKWEEYPGDWDPRTDDRTPVWEACHQLIRVLKQHGEAAAGRLLARMPELGEPIRQLAYHLYTVCERKKWAEDARAYNELIGSWHAIVAASHEAGHKDEQIGLEF